MGKALYREYRPKKLADVVGQEHITTTLQNALKKQAISHAYLFTGPRGVGKTSVARILAHEINGIAYDDEAMHMDIIEIDAASNRRIDEMRELRDKVYIAPTSSKYKVYIIDEVHMLTREAFNALLKTLEEPPAHAVFILATTEAHKVPDTIISRTQRFSFRPIAKEHAVAQLRRIAEQENVSISDEALALLAEHGRGSFRDSISLLDQIVGFDAKHIDKAVLEELLGLPSEQTLYALLNAAKENNATALFEATTNLRVQGANPSVVAQKCIALLRDQLANNTAIVSPATAVQLMKELLPLTASAATYEAIEIAFLGVLQDIPSAKAHEPPKPLKESKKESNPTLPKEPAQKPQPEASIPAAEELETTQVTDEAPVLAADGDQWSAILNQLKGHHNTLYGVLRMASVQVSDTSLILEFQFAFHQKQAAQAKHVTILREVVEKVVGKPLEIQMIVSATASQTPPPTKPAKAPEIDLKSVSNIFGGAELLES